MLVSVADRGQGVCGVVLLLGNDLVPWVLGAAYQPMAIHLLPLSLTLPVQVLSNMAILRTLVNNYLKKRRWLQG